MEFGCWWLVVGSRIDRSTHGYAHIDEYKAMAKPRNIKAFVSHPKFMYDWLYHIKANWKSILAMVYTSPYLDVYSIWLMNCWIDHSSGMVPCQWSKLGWTPGEIQGAHGPDADGSRLLVSQHAGSGHRPGCHGAVSWGFKNRQFKSALGNDVSEWRLDGISNDVWPM